jgi:hypothetical protein
MRLKQGVGSSEAKKRELDVKNTAMSMWKFAQKWKFESSNVSFNR